MNVNELIVDYTTVMTKPEYSYNRRTVTIASEMDSAMSPKCQLITEDIDISKNSKI